MYAIEQLAENYTDFLLLIVIIGITFTIVKIINEIYVLCSLFLFFVLFVCLC